MTELLFTLCSILSIPIVVNGFLPSQNPPWSSTYNMSMSTITMACNSSGWFNTTLAASFGITSFDWSNAKAQWAQQFPMDDEERLITQTSMTKSLQTDTKVFIYENLVKALPWMTTVREKLEDPAYSGFFLKFSPNGPWNNGTYHVPKCDNNYDPPLCSDFYHDQEQSPGYPSGDGSCAAPACDCGSVPCGEYLFDHRNGTMLQDFLINEVILGKNGLGNENVSGWFLDDFWCSDLVNGTGNCNDPVQGPTECDAHSQVDMGLSDQDIADITNGWLQTHTLAQQAILDQGGYTWSLAPNQDNANAMPQLIDPDEISCKKWLSSACDKESIWQTAPLLFGLHPGNETNPFPYLEQDVAAFLLARGDYAYLGYGVWGMSWPAGITWDDPSDGTSYSRPIQMDTDYGYPLDPTCSETFLDSGVFTRRYTNCDVLLDCNSFSAHVNMH